MYELKDDISVLQSQLYNDLDASRTSKTPTIPDQTIVLPQPRSILDAKESSFKELFPSIQHNAKLIRKTPQPTPPRIRIPTSRKISIKTSETSPPKYKPYEK